ncbi:unnamed protein product [Danaus chrysippus]|uniref:Lipase n=1 Tax=Danaus chrysippus TaxID=151541 RepID=A0A8J2W549_9NEOP|nr:unnamed protein product [Danaus chrysippus]
MSIRKVLLVVLSVILATNYFYNVVLPSNKIIRFPEIVKQNGYTSEEYDVVTEDGYIINLFRIRGNKCDQLRRPVLILHGLFQSSDSWLDPGANYSLPYLLSDKCHDVWVGNTRGNYYGRRHTSLDPDNDDKFWQFSADEIGYYDIPAMIDSVLNITKAAKLNYIGFSQGGGSFYMLCSERPEYNGKVNAMVGMGTPTTLQLSNGPLQTMFSTVMKLENLFYKLGINEVFSRNMMAHKLINLICVLSKTVCHTIISSFDEYNPASHNEHTLFNTIKHFPDGTSIRNLARYGQAGFSDRFQKYDFGKTGNMERYGTHEPPTYNLQNVKVPVLLVQGRRDWLVNITELETFSKKLPNLKELFIVNDLKWNHFDLMYSHNLKQLVFPKINEYLLT